MTDITLQEEHFQKVKSAFVKIGIQMSDEDIRANLPLFIPSIDNYFCLSQIANEIMELDARY